jgi:hypothetical protein
MEQCRREGVMVYVKSFILWCVLGVAVLIGLLIGSVDVWEMPKAERRGTDLQQD